jgi:hypothetical protein
MIDWISFNTFFEKNLKCILDCMRKYITKYRKTYLKEIKIETNMKCVLLQTK